MLPGLVSVPAFRTLAVVPLGKKSSTAFAVVSLKKRVPAPTVRPVGNAVAKFFSL